MSSTTIDPSSVPLVSPLVIPPPSSILSPTLPTPPSNQTIINSITATLSTNISTGSVTLSNVVSYLKNAIELVENNKINPLSGSDKQSIVITVLQNLLASSPLSQEEKDLITMVLPSVINLVVEASNGLVNINKKIVADVEGTNCYKNCCCIM